MVILLLAPQEDQPYVVNVFVFDHVQRVELGNKYLGYLPLGKKSDSEPPMFEPTST